MRFTEGLDEDTIDSNIYHSDLLDYIYSANTIKQFLLSYSHPTPNTCESIVPISEVTTPDLSMGPAHSDLLSRYLPLHRSHG
jgi:hypothetical protein